MKPATTYGHNLLRRLHAGAAAKLAVCLVLTLVMPAACRKTPATLPPSKGLPYELVVIVPRVACEGALADSIDAVLRASTPVLPQHEPLFRLDIVKADAFGTDGYPQGRHLTPWRTFRLRLILTVDRTAGAPSMGIATNVYARPQTEVCVKARSVAELAVYLGQVRERVVEIFTEAELAHESAGLRRRHSRVTAETMQGVGHRVCTPTELNARKVGVDFVWTGTNRGDRDQNFVYYTYPWDGRALTIAGFVAKRDSVMRANIPGSTPGQWMQTARLHGKDGSPADATPLAMECWRVINNNVRVHEVRGLWELHAGAMGGPFIAHERVDTVARRVVVAEVFIFSPHSPKRNLLRQMEAALRTFE